MGTPKFVLFLCERSFLLIELIHVIHGLFHKWWAVNSNIGNKHKTGDEVYLEADGAWDDLDSILPKTIYFKRCLDSLRRYY